MADRFRSTVLATIVNQVEVLLARTVSSIAPDRQEEAAALAGGQFAWHSALGIVDEVLEGWEGTDYPNAFFAREYDNPGTSELNAARVAIGRSALSSRLASTAISRPEFTAQSLAVRS